MAITINVNLDEILAALKNDLDFTGNADKYIKVNATADGFEFAAVNVGSTWGSITGTLSDQTDLQSALDLKANLAGASFTGDVSVTTSGSGDTLQLINSGSGTTLNITNSGSGDFLTIDSTKLVIDNGGDVSIGTATALARFHVETGATDKVGAIISAAAGQTANLLEVKNSSGTNMTLITSDGTIRVGSLIRVGPLTLISSTQVRVGNNNVQLNQTPNQPIVRIRKEVSNAATKFLSFIGTNGITQIAAFENSGAFTPASLADSGAENGTIYYSTDAGKLVYKDSGGVVNDLY